VVIGLKTTTNPSLAASHQTLFVHVASQTKHQSCRRMFLSPF